MRKALLFLFLVGVCAILAGCDSSYWEPAPSDTPTPGPVYTVRGKVTIDKQDCAQNYKGRIIACETELSDHLPSALSLEDTKVEVYAVLLDYKGKTDRGTNDDGATVRLIADDTGGTFARLSEDDQAGTTVMPPGHWEVTSTPDGLWDAAVGCYQPTPELNQWTGRYEQC